MRKLEGLEEGLKAKIHLDPFRVTLKKVPNWKMPVHNGVHGYCFKKFTSIHNLWAIKMNYCLQKTDNP